MRPRALFAIFVSALLASACGSLRGDAEAAMARGDYLQAELLYGKLATRDPLDQEVQARRKAARVAWIRAELAPVRATRTAGRWAMASQRHYPVLVHVESWTDLPPEVRAEVDTETAALVAAMEAEIQGPLSNGRLLEARKALNVPSHEVFRHKAFASRLSTLAERVRSAGEARCGVLLSEAPADKSPYAREVARTYCRAFGKEVLPHPLSHTRRDLIATGGINGVSSKETDNLRAAVSQWFRQTVWYSEVASESGQSTLAGIVQAERSQAPMTLTQPWTEQIPFVAYETYQEPYQEPYTDTESYYERVPYTDQETYTYDCGTRTCTGTRPVTRYRDELRTRTVTKYRTAYRTATRAVTRYRPEPRVFTYEAVQYTVSRAADLAVAIDRGPGAAPFVIRVPYAETSKGLVHNVTFEPAGIRPRSDPLPTDEAFFAAATAKLQAEFLASLTRRYRDLYCTATRYTYEEAARCAIIGAVKGPLGVHDAFMRVHGAEAGALEELFDRRREPR